MAAGDVHSKLRLHVVVEGGLLLADTERRLKRAGQTGLRKELRKGLRDAANPTLKQLRRAVKQVQVRAQPPSPEPRRTPHRPLRLKVSRAMRLSMKPARGLVRIEVSPKAFPPGDIKNPPTLPKYLDATIKRGRANFIRWRHPVFWSPSIKTAPPNRIAQQIGEPWFFSTINKRRALMRREMFNSIERVRDQIVRGP